MGHHLGFNATGGTITGLNPQKKAQFERKSAALSATETKLRSGVGPIIYSSTISTTCWTINPISFIGGGSDDFLYCWELTSRANPQVKAGDAVFHDFIVAQDLKRLKADNKTIIPFFSSPERQQTSAVAADTAPLHYTGLATVDLRRKGDDTVTGLLRYGIFFYKRSWGARLSPVTGNA